MWNVFKKPMSCNGQSADLPCFPWFVTWFEAGAILITTRIYIAIMFENTDRQGRDGWWWLWYHSLTAHQHQKGHIVPKQVTMICNVNSSRYSLRTALCESIRYQAKSEQNVPQDLTPRVANGKAAPMHPGRRWKDRIKIMRWRLFITPNKPAMQSWQKFPKCKLFVRCSGGW